MGQTTPELHPVELLQRLAVAHDGVSASPEPNLGVSQTISHCWWQRRLFRALRAEPLRNSGRLCLQSSVAVQTQLLQGRACSTRPKKRDEAAGARLEKQIHLPQMLRQCHTAIHERPHQRLLESVHFCVVVRGVQQPPKPNCVDLRAAQLRDHRKKQRSLRLRGVHRQEPLGGDPFEAILGVPELVQLVLRHPEPLQRGVISNSFRQLLHSHRLLLVGAVDSTQREAHRLQRAILRQRLGQQVHTVHVDGQADGVEFHEVLRLDDEPRQLAEALVVENVVGHVELLHAVEAQ
mmetsp:Transcript_30135/g.77742  ORF Transcript_30135/g.77742 Transcript_30135/m.77742 type:complete len:292 (-) Transcript_30135:907-1782(-)